MYTQGPVEVGLRAALVTLRLQLADDYINRNGFMTPQALMSTKLLDRIVDLAHYGKLSTLPNYHAQVTWGFNDVYGPHIFALVQQFHPAPSSTPFTTEPLQTSGQTSNQPPTASTTTKTQRKCKLCAAPGHYGMSVCILPIIRVPDRLR